MIPTPLRASSPLFYVEAGGDGDPVVLLHGLGADHRTWRHVQPQLAQSWRVFTPDLPGHGRSPKPQRTHDLAFYTSYIMEWLKALDLGPVHLVGHSLGAAAAVSVAAEHPERVQSVGAICPILLAEHEFPSAARKAFFATRLAYLFGSPSAEKVQGLMAQGLGIAAPTDELVALWQETTRLSAYANRSTVAQLSQGEAILTEKLPQLRCPVWILWGERDPLFPGRDKAEQVAQAIPQVTVEFMDSAYLPMFEQPEAFRERLLAHLRRIANP